MLQAEVMRAPLLFVLVAMLGCSTEDADKTPGNGERAADEVAQGEAGAAAADTRKIAVRCTMGDAIEAPVREAIVTRATELVDALRSGRHDALWQALHDQAKTPADRQGFMDTLAALQSRLEGVAPGAPAVETIAFGDVEGGVNDVARLVCRRAESDAKADEPAPPDLTLLVNAGNEDVAYVSLLLPGSVYEHAAVLQLRKRENTWYLLGIQVHPSKFKGKSAVDWVSQAGQLRRSSKLVPAYVALAIASAMASRGPSVTTPLSTAIETDLETLRKHPLFVAETKTWTIDGQDFDLHGLTLAATQSDVSLVVKYVNERGLVEDLVGRDADVLMDHVRTTYPELQGLVDAVVFEAYAKAPTDAGATVDAYRVARFF